MNLHVCWTGKHSSGSSLVLHQQRTAQQNHISKRDLSLLSFDINLLCQRFLCFVQRYFYSCIMFFLSHQFSFALTKETLRNFIPEKSQILSFLFALWEWSFWAPVVHHRAVGPLPALESRCVGSWTSAVQKLLVWSANKPDSSRLLCLLWSQNAFLPRPEFLWL